MKKKWLYSPQEAVDECNRLAAELAKAIEIMIIIPDKLRRPAEVEREELRKAEARAEVERKDKLIEQMREALKDECLNHCEERFSRDCPPNDCRGCKIKAALEAAERGE